MTLEQYKKKFLGFMTADQIAEVEVSNQGFVYKGNVIVAVSGLDKLIEVEKQAETQELTYKKIENIVKKIESLETTHIEKLEDIAPVVEALKKFPAEKEPVVKTTSKKKSK